LQNGHKTNPQSSSKQTNCASYKDAGGRHQKVAPNSLATSTLLSFEGDQEPLVSNRFDCSDGDDLEENQEREPFVGVDSGRIAAESTGSPKIEFRRVVDEYGDGDSDIHGYGVSTSDECGGGHSHLNFLTTSNKKLNFSSCLLLVGLSTHSVFEGIALGVQAENKCGLLKIDYNIDHKMYFIRTRILIIALIHSVILGELTRSSSVDKRSVFQVNSLDSQFSLLIRFVLEGLAAGTFIYVACVQMLSAELSANHAHSHQPQSAKCRDSFALDERHSPHPQTDMHIRKALAVIMGVCVFFVLSVVFGRHHAMASINKHSGLSTNSH
uniref:Zinc transporter ZIP1 n=1 Tax=Anisakis simplex TaxID=6269 RepID=A0A0M3K9E7_ANISI